MKINWITGAQEWAYKYLVKHIVSKMSKHQHVFNQEQKSNEITFLVAPTQLPKYQANSKTILHIDGNRWYECIDQ